MIELFQEDEVMNEYRSSKGNQLKWKSGGYWYKADQNGYEGLSEYVVSNLLQRSTLNKEKITVYETEEIRYRKRTYRGCKSRDFLQEGESLITLERLYWHAKGNRSLYKCIFSIPDETDRIRFLVNEIQQITGLKKFGEYLCLLLEIDSYAAHTPFYNEAQEGTCLDPSGSKTSLPAMRVSRTLISNVAANHFFGSV